MKKFDVFAMADFTRFRLYGSYHFFEIRRRSVGLRILKKKMCDTIFPKFYQGII